MRRRIILGLFMIVIFAAGATAASAQRWRELGSAEVSDRVDRDTIRVTALKGDLRRIKLAVSGAPVRFYRVVVTFRNGRTRQVAVRSLIRAGGETRAIDLPGRERVIEKVDFWYEAASLGRGKARVTLYGLD